MSVVIPSIKLPSPISTNPKIGTRIPPINNPIALILSDTATAFKPPKTAYIEPIIQIPHTQILIAAAFETPSNAGTSNIPLIATDPEYRIMGNSTTT